MIYKCKKETIYPPPHFIKCNCSDDYKESVCVDLCLAGEIVWLWDKEIETKGCCCGHGKHLGYIEVSDDCIQKMRDLGYQNYIYDDEFGGHERKSAFIPKSTHHFYDGYSEGFLG